MPYATNRRCCLVLRFRSSLTYSGDVGQRHALRRTLGPPPGRRRETPAQREALPHTLDYNVAECDDLQPGNLGMRFSKLMRHSAARFPEESQTVQDSALDQNVAEECFPSVFGELGDHFDLFCGVEETEAVRPHKETASRVTSDARRGLSPRLETTSTLHPRTASRSSHRPVRSSSDRPRSKSTRKSISESWR